MVQAINNAKKLAEELGYKSVKSLCERKCAVLKRYPERKQEIKKMFSKDGRVFFSEFFDAFKAVCADARKMRSKKTQDKAKPVVVKHKRKAGITAARKRTKTTTESILLLKDSGDRFDLNDVKALLKYLDGVQKLGEEIKKKRAERDSIMAEAVAEKEDFNKCGELLNKAAEINKSLAESQAEFEKLASKFNHGKELVKQLESLGTEITEFLAEVKKQKTI